MIGSRHIQKELATQKQILDKKLFLDGSLIENIVVKLLKIKVLFKNVQLVLKAMCTNCSFMMDEELASWGLNKEDNS